jgi:hypothetical protein
LQHHRKAIAVDHLVVPGVNSSIDQLGYLGPPLACSQAVVGSPNQMVHLWGFSDMGEFERRHLVRDRDPDWSAYLRASETLFVAQKNRLVPSLESYDDRRSTWRSRARPHQSSIVRIRQYG